MKLNVNGIHINYRIDGLEGAPWVTMSNSLATTHRMWDDQMDAFTQHYRVLRYDKRGHGETDVAPGLGIVLTLPPEHLVQVFNHRKQGALLHILGTAKRHSRDAFLAHLLP